MKWNEVLINAIRHFKRICVHKYWVGRYCFKAGLYWQGLTHDLSKFSHVEFMEAVRYYQGNKSPIKACKEQKGYSMALLHHRGHNLHHYHHWVDDFDNYHTKGLTLIKMPYKYAVEMICDYLGAARAYLGDDFSYTKEWQWWLNKRNSCAMHLHTKAFVDTVLWCMAESESDDILMNKGVLRKIYESD